MSYEDLAARYGKAAVRVIEILKAMEEACEGSPIGKVLERFADVPDDDNLTLALISLVIKGKNEVQYRNEEGGEREATIIYDAFTLGAVTGYKLAQKRFTQ